jgi:hypothetical protein
MMPGAFFDLDGGVYLPRDAARGPWSPDHCHAGPVAGAIARGVETAAGAKRQLVRLTIDLIRPVPMAGFRVTVEMTRAGKRLATAQAAVQGLDGKTAATASAMLVTPASPVDLLGLSGPADRPDDAREGPFLTGARLHDKPFLGDFVQVRFPPGETDAPGPTRLWMRTPALVAGEGPSPFQRLCPIADCGNAIGRNGEVDRFTFLNTDLTIVCHRASTSDWLLSDARAHWYTDGIGLAEARISDEHGPVATALQSLIVSRVEN